MNDSETTELAAVEQDSKEVGKLILKNRNDDYTYGRETLYFAAERMYDIVETATNLARESEHPRAVEVAAAAAEKLADVADKLMKHHANIDKLNNPNGSAPSTVNNNLNVKLSTSDLLEMLTKDR